MMMRFAFVTVLVLVFTFNPAARAETGIAQSPISMADLDTAAQAEWVNGKEQPFVVDRDPNRTLIWTRDSRPSLHGVTFGESSEPGPRHLRVAFKAPVAIGSILVSGGGRLSVLKPDATYPGDLNNDADWEPAARLDNGTVADTEVDKKELAVWVLKPGTRTRAIRFTHIADVADSIYTGYLGGAVVLTQRLVNLAPQAMVTASARDEAAGKLNNMKDEDWSPWDNGAEGGSATISPEHAEWITLTWPRAVTLSGLEALRAGFGAAELDVYTGDAASPPRGSESAAWRNIAPFELKEEGYPYQFWPQRMDLDKPITTRAIRLRLTGVAREGHPHMKGRTKDGRRVWVNELMAMMPLGDADVASAILPKQASETHPPIAVRFTLPEPGNVTLVIEDAAGKRVRNLIADEPYPAGENVAWWDGSDDLERDRDAPRHGVYHVPTQPVEPGTYHIRGLYHKSIDLRYEFSVYNRGNPPWSTADTSGGWLTNHTPPQAALYVPGAPSPTGKPMIYLGSAVSEGGAGLAWVDLDGNKIGGRGWVGGNWTAAPYLTRDTGDHALPDVYAYVGATWTAASDNKDRTHGELRLTALTAKGDKAIVKYPFTPASEDDGDTHWIAQLGGLAVHDGLIAASLRQVGALIFIDARTGNTLGRTPIQSPRGLAFDHSGRLLVLSGTKLLRLTLDAHDPGASSQTKTLIDAGLDDPVGLATDPDGRICISDQGTSHQVKVFDETGKLINVIGHAGPPADGLYDPLHMNHPHGLTIDERGHIWVAENDFQPKRVSVWTRDGELVHAFYGPCRYGGGGSLDPRDRTRFYYDGVEFKLDWDKGESQPAAIFFRENSDVTRDQFRAGPPQTPIYLRDRQYMTNCYNSNPTGGMSTVALWIMRDHVARVVASFGRAADWKLLKTDAFKPRWPEGVNLAGDPWKNPAMFVWSDVNANGSVEPDEVTIIKANSGGVTFARDLSILVSRVDGKAMRYAPVNFTDAGVPIYDLAAANVLAEGAQNPASSGGDQAMISDTGWTVLTVAPEPFAREGFGGLRDGKPLWSYPSLWPGLHASHEAPTPTFRGEVIGSTRLLGDFVTPHDSDAGPLWCINGNSGDMYVFTADGLFVAQLFQDARTGQPWTMPKAQRDMLLNDVTLHDENFFPTIAQTSDGNIYLCDGARSALVRVDGLESIRRLPDVAMQLTADDLRKAEAWRLEAEAARQAQRGTGVLKVAMRDAAPTVDGKLDDWDGAQWAVIDRRGVAAHFNSDSKPYDITGAVAVAGDRLYAAWKTRDPDLLKNSGETPNAPFKTGGCLDLMIGSDPAADPNRRKPVAGDERLLITQIKDKTVALLYRAVVPGTKEPVPFASPWRTITIDRVDDLSDQVQLAITIEKDERGRPAAAMYEMSIPLAALDLNPAPGQTINGDIGVLRGNGFQTLQRSYWNNKATAITADVPSEAELTPGLWGRWTFTKPN
ncbi:MAG: hypothetical protein GC162_15935 [Planctomycetes bacterium]|nr:hypothetical protein [Planctomycetota bacterium]